MYLHQCRTYTGSTKQPDLTSLEQELYQQIVSMSEELLKITAEFEEICNNLIVTILIH